jgi:folate-dependent phosphoribosylglycinamide formyltransferase PurN
MNILILTSYQPHNIYVVNRIVKDKEVIGRVIEDRGLVKKDTTDKWRLWNGIRKRYGLIKAIDRYLYIKYYARFVQERETQAKIDMLFPGGKKVEYEDDVPTIEVGSVNDEKVVEFVSRLSPDVICVCGTSVVKPRVFNLAKYGSINIHVGITPEYRSAKPIEWALYNKDYDNVGVTVHFVDEGIDTGDIIYQEAIQISPGDSVGSIYAKCKIKGCDLMLRAVSDIEEGGIKRWRKEGIEGRKYISHEFGLSNYLKMVLNLRKRR